MNVFDRESDTHRGNPLVSRHGFCGLQPPPMRGSNIYQILPNSKRSHFPVQHASSNPTCLAINRLKLPGTLGNPKVCPSRNNINQFSPCLTCTIWGMGDSEMAHAAPALLHTFKARVAVCAAGIRWMGWPSPLPQHLFQGVQVTTPQSTTLFNSRFACVYAGRTCVICSSETCTQYGVD